MEYHFVIAVNVFVDGFGWNGHLIPYCSSARAWNSFLFLCVFFGFFVSAFEFSDYWSFMSLIKCVARCFILFDAIISGIFLIFVSDCY